MKKGLLIVSLALISFLTIAQDDGSKVKFGIHVGPSFSTSRLRNDNISDATIEKNGTKIKFSAGLSIENFVQDNIAFYFGLDFKTKYASFSYLKNNTLFTPEVNLQYVSLPIALKLYTNQFADNYKVYFMAGGNVDFKLDEVYKTNDHFTNNDIKAVNGKMITWYDLGLVFGLGGEYQIPNTSNVLFAGFHYNRGLANVLKNKFTPDVNGKKIMLRNDLYEIVFGFKF